MSGNGVLIVGNLKFADFDVSTGQENVGGAPEPSKLRGREPVAFLVEAPLGSPI